VAPPTYDRFGMDGVALPPPRREDVFRHLQDLRAGTFEGADSRDDRVALFRRAVALLDAVVRAVLEEANGAFLAASGSIGSKSVEVHQSGDADATWELSWPEQREAKNVRAGGVVRPIQVVAWFAAGFTHPHLRGSAVGNWPLQVLDAADARRQEPIVRAIVEAELHERIFEGTWRIVPSFARTGGELEA
jgi:hypothetical protein